jgi:hypothetical protein
VTEGEPVDNHEIAQTQSVRKIIYLMQYPHLKVRHTSCSMVTTEHSYGVTSQYCNATDIDIHRPIAINKTLQSRVYTLFFTDTLSWNTTRCNSSTRLTFGVLQFHLLFGFDYASVTGYLYTSNNKCTLRRNVGNGLPVTRRYVPEASIMQKQRFSNLNTQTVDSY